VNSSGIVGCADEQAIIIDHDTVIPVRSAVIAVPEAGISDLAPMNAIRRTPDFETGCAISHLKMHLLFYILAC
jgi:hypothetical protein